MTPIADRVTALNSTPGTPIQTSNTGRLGGPRPGAGRPPKVVPRPPETAEGLRAYHEGNAAYAAGTRDRLQLSRQAAAFADVCGRCGRPIAANEAVWRAVVGHGLWGSHCRLTVWCLDCAPPEDSRRTGGGASAARAAPPRSFGRPRARSGRWDLSLLPSSPSSLVRSGVRLDDLPVRWNSKRSSPGLATRGVAFSKLRDEREDLQKSELTAVPARAM